MCSPSVSGVVKVTSCFSLATYIYSCCFLKIFLATQECTWLNLILKGSTQAKEFENSYLNKLDGKKVGSDFDKEDR